MNNSVNKPNYLKCEHHPDAMVIHSWNETQCVLNGIPAGFGVATDHEYRCQVCSRILTEPVIRGDAVTCPKCGNYYGVHATGGFDICCCHETKNH